MRLNDYILVSFFCHMQIYNRVEVGETLSVDTITAYLKKKFPKANAARILGVDSNYDDNRKVMLLRSVMCSITKMPGKTAVGTFSVKMSQFNLQRIIYKIISVHIACVIALVNINCCLLKISRQTWTYRCQCLYEQLCVFSGRRSVLQEEWIRRPTSGFVQWCSTQ